VIDRQQVVRKRYVLLFTADIMIGYYISRVKGNRLLRKLCLLATGWRFIMKRVLLLIVLSVSIFMFGFETDELFNEMISKGPDFISFAGAGFEAKFIPVFSVSENDIELMEGVFLHGLLIFRSERVMEIRLDSIQVIDAVSDERVSVELYRVETLFSPMALPVTLSSGGVLVLTGSDPLRDYFMDVRVQSILIPWRIRSVEPGRVVDIASVGVDPLAMASNIVADNTEGYESISENIADLNDRLNFLQDNVEGLNLQFRRLNTLFLDTQVALAEYKAAVDISASDLQQRSASLENRLNTLESRLSSVSADIGEIVVLRRNIEDINKEMADLKLVLPQVQEAKSLLSELEEGFSSLSERISSLEGKPITTEELEEFARVVEETTARVETIGNLAAALEKSNTLLLSELEALSVTSNRLEGLFEKTANSILEAEKRIETLEEKAGFLDARIVDSTAELDSKIAQIGLLANSAEARILELGNANKELLSRLNDIGGRIGVMELLLTGINDRVVALEKRVPSVADFETSLKSALSGIETLGNSVGRLEISLATVENSLAELADAKVNQIDSEKIEKEIASLRENLGGLSMSFIRLNSDLIQLRDSIPPEGVSPEQFSNKTYEIDMRIGSLESDLVSIEARISGLNAVLSNLDKKLQSLGVELDSIKGNFDGSVTAIDNNLRSIQRLQTDLNGLKELVAENKENLKALREETAELLVTREEIASIVDEAVKSVREETTQEIAALRRSNSIWLAVAVISSIAAIVLGVINIMP